MPLRVASIAAECEPWAKTGGLGDVVDALARSLGHVPGAIDGSVEVFLPRYRSVPGPAAIARDAWYDDDTILGRAAIVMTLHNLAYHGWTARDSLGQLGLAPGGGVVPAAADGIDLLREGIVRAEMANTVSPGFARE